MNILFLTQILPYPPDAGPRVKTLQVLRYLVENGHNVTLVSFVREDEEKHIEALQMLLPEFYPIKLARSRVADAMYLTRSLFKRRPFLVERDNIPEMRRLVHHLLKTCSFDAIHTDQLTMTQFALDLPNIGKPVLRVFDAHNATWSILERIKTNTQPLLRPLIALEARRIKDYEGRIVRLFEYTLAVTTIDRNLLIEAASEVTETIPSTVKRTIEDKLLTVPITVDTTALPVAPRPVRSTKIITLGTLHYPPNADGIRWFLHQVFPFVREKCPGAHLTIIGKNPPADLLERAAREPSAVEITGYVDDLEPYFARSALMVVPVRAGGGMRVRILEGFARGIPTVTTTIGLEGIDAQPEMDVLIGDTAEEFADQVIRLLNEPALQVQLSLNGRQLAEDVYDRQVALRKMESIYTRQL